MRSGSWRSPLCSSRRPICCFLCVGLVEADPDAPQLLDRISRELISRGTFPVLSRNPAFQEAIKNSGGTDPFFEKNDG